MKSVVNYQETSRIGFHWGQIGVSAITKIRFYPISFTNKNTRAHQNHANSGVIFKTLTPKLFKFDMYANIYYRHITGRYKYVTHIVDPVHG